MRANALRQRIFSNKHRKEGVAGTETGRDGRAAATHSGGAGGVDVDAYPHFCYFENDLNRPCDPKRISYYSTQLSRKRRPLPEWQLLALE